MVKRITHFSTGHPRNETRVHLKECRTLAQAGYDVTFLTADGGGEGWDGDIHLIDIGKPAHRLLRISWSPMVMFFACLRTRADLYHFHDPELLPVGLLLKAFGKVAVYDCHENVAGSLADRGTLPVWLRNCIAMLFRHFERFVGSRIDGVIAVSEPIRAQFTSAKRSVVVSNFPTLPNVFVDAIPYQEREKLFVFVGNLNVIRGARPLMAALGLVQDPEVRLKIVGRIAPDGLARELSQSGGWSRVESIGWSDKDVVDASLTEGRAGLVLFLPARNHIESRPNKLFEYMAAGLPLIVSDFRSWRDLLEDVGCALFVDPENPVAIADAMNWIIENPREAETMGSRGREAVRARFNWNQEANTLVGFYRQILGQ